MSAVPGEHSLETVPSDKNDQGSVLHIRNFVRPFTLAAAREYLGRFGTVQDFWMDQIKTHCYVHYSTTEEAAQCRTAVHGVQWPSDTGKALFVEAASSDAMRQAVESPAAHAAQPRVEKDESLQAADVVETSHRIAAPSAPSKSLDKLFLKTETQPSLYYKLSSLH